MHRKPNEGIPIAGDSMDRSSQQDTGSEEHVDPWDCAEAMNGDQEVLSTCTGRRIQ